MNVAEAIIAGLADYGIRQIWGVVGDALNPFTDAIRRDGRIEWIGVRHEEAAAFAAGAQAQLTGELAVCMGTVGPGALHLVNGLYDARKSHAPVLAICGQVPTEEIGSDFFQEVDNDRVFAAVAGLSRTLSDASQLPQLLESAVNTAIARRTVSVLTVPGDVGGRQLGKHVPVPRFAPPAVPAAAPAEQLDRAAELINKAKTVTLLVGCGAREARAQVLQLAERLKAPMVLTIKAKEGLEAANPYQVGQTGLLGNPAAAKALDGGELLLMVGTDFPYRDWYPSPETVVQLDQAAEHIGRRIPVDHAVVGDAGRTLKELLIRLDERSDDDHLRSALTAYEKWNAEQAKLTEPDHDQHGLLNRIRGGLDNPDERIRPEALAAAIDRVAPEDTIFTTDTGMSTVWLARFVTMRGTRRLLGSFNLGSMANAMPQALGAQALDRSRPVLACCGDGGLMMLLGDLRTAVTYRLPATFVIFDNGRLGMVKLEQEEGGLPEFGTELDNPDLAAVAEAIGCRSWRVERADQLDAVLAEAIAYDGPAVVDVITNPDEVSLPPKTGVDEAWGFAIAKAKETLRSA